MKIAEPIPYLHLFSSFQVNVLSKIAVINFYYTLPGLVITQLTIKNFPFLFPFLSAKTWIPYWRQEGKAYSVSDQNGQNPHPYLKAQHRRYPFEACRLGYSVSPRPMDIRCLSSISQGYKLPYGLRRILNGGAWERTTIIKMAGEDGGKQATKHGILYECFRSVFTTLGRFVALCCILAYNERSCIA